MELEILYQDDYVVAVNKPHGLLVHRTGMDKDATEFALQHLRNQLNQQVSPIHRLDRKTSGVLLFSLDSDVHRLISTQFENNQVKKEYRAIVRGFVPEKGIIDYALTNLTGKQQEAVSGFELLEHIEIPVSYSGFKTSRYSLVKIFPETGRYHQIRKHFAHIFHPIIGDRPHGCNKQNRLFKEKWGIMNMMLSSTALKFHHPVYDREVKITAGLSPEMKSCYQMLKSRSVF